MLIYYILLAVIVLDFALEYFYNKSQIKSNKLKKILDFIFRFRIISITALVLVSTLRSYSVGRDIEVYRDCFNSYKTQTLSQAMEINRFEFGYFILTFIFAKIGLDFRFVLFVSSLFISVCTWLFIKEFSPNKLMSLILFICFGIFAQSLNIIRQIIALGFILLALTMLHKNKIWLYFLFIALACLFHLIAIVGVVFILFKYVKPTWQLVVFAVILTMFVARIFPYALKFISKFTPTNYYEQYFIIEKIKFITVVSLKDKLYTLALTAVLLGFMILRQFMKNLNEEEQKVYDFFLLMYLFVPLIRLAGWIISAQNLVQRFSVFFFFSLIILLPLCLKGLNLKKNLKITAYSFAYIVSFCYMYYFYAIQSSNGVVPYLFCF